ncbi:MAG: hypothetical protein AAB365_01240 [Patescibacteria group bacterium]
MKKTLSLTLIILGFLLGASALSAVAAWTAPGCAPTGCNTDAPINASSSPQTKYGPLTLNFSNIYAIGLKVLGSVQIVDGTQGAGKVLTSDASGIASWVLPAAAGGGTSVNGIAAYTTPGSHTWTVPANAKFAEVTVVGGGGSGYVIVTRGNVLRYGLGGLATKTIPLTGVTSASVTVGAAGDRTGVYPGGASSVVIGGNTISASGGSGFDGAGSGGDVNGSGPYFGFGYIDQDVVRNGAVVIRYY